MRRRPFNDYGTSAACEVTRAARRDGGDEDDEAYVFSGQALVQNLAYDAHSNDE